ncbi:protein kinase [Corallococcus sp. M34]|uniref:protein kinase domain-containing protein n=1 Tax=Citreicoccus inhibens TaxID=2849499 RepID=UPI001C22A74C|nr:serine/threonine-protein kinase [Citreicoccus inhibens]MBU8896905.1 protein kinase [Citreicoccus inhibens]
MTLEAGTRIGKYVVRRKLAEGGMAEIYLCTARGPEGFEKEVVIKRVRAFLASDSEFVQMFIAEARLASRLNHANVVQIFDFDKHEDTYYLAMEYVRGCSLWELRKRCKEHLTPIPPTLVAYMGAEIARALHAAHRLKINGEHLHLVHRDVTPHNVLLSFDGAVKLTDFGIAKAGNRLSQPGVLKGKFAYMSPEQARGEAVDARTDIFALGVVLWEMLTGGRLFDGDSEVAVLRAVQHSLIPPPARLNPDVPADLDAAVMRALQRDPNARFQTASELERALAQSALQHARSVDDTNVGMFLRRLFPEAATYVALPAVRDRSQVGQGGVESPVVPVAREPTAVMRPGRERPLASSRLSPDEDVDAATVVLPRREDGSPELPPAATPMMPLPAVRLSVRPAGGAAAALPPVAAPIAAVRAGPPDAAQADRGAAERTPRGEDASTISVPALREGAQGLRADASLEHANAGVGAAQAELPRRPESPSKPAELKQGAGEQAAEGRHSRGADASAASGRHSGSAGAPVSEGSHSSGSDASAAPGRHSGEADASSAGQVALAGKGGVPVAAEGGVAAAAGSSAHSRGAPGDVSKPSLLEVVGAPAVQSSRPSEAGSPRAQGPNAAVASELTPAAVSSLAASKGRKAWPWLGAGALGLAALVGFVAIPRTRTSDASQGGSPMAPSAKSPTVVASTDAAPEHAAQQAKPTESAPIVTPRADTVAHPTKPGESAPAVPTQPSSSTEQGKTASESDAEVEGLKRESALADEPRRPNAKSPTEASAPADAGVVALGTLKLRASPYATVFLDGKRLGEVQGLASYRLTAGTYRLTFEHPSGAKSLTVTIPANGSVSRDFRATTGR